MTRDLNDKHYAEIQKLTENEQSLRQQIKQAQRDHERVKNEIASLKQTMQVKESGVKSDLERLCNEWQEKVEFAENEW